MYESYWQLRQKPFENYADPQFYFPGESHQAALLKLRYAVENRRGAALLAGAAGTGKTLIFSMLRAALGETYSPVVRLVYPQMPAADLLAYLADELDGSSSATGRVPESVRRIEQFLTANTQKGRHAVVLVDEAHLIENCDVLETLRLLLNFGPDGQPSMTLLLAGQPGILPTLDRMPQLEERLGVKCLLRPFTRQETGEYLTHRLAVAGAVRPIIEPEAVPAIYELTHGIARQIHRLCDLALLVGFAEEQRTLTAANFQAVSRELVALVPE
jgi:type II secretory pathway predicted ATPase ExeA